MDPEAAIEGLRLYGSTLRECLAGLDGAAPEDPLVGRSFDELEARFSALGDLQELRREVPPEYSERIDAELEELTRLNAVLLANVARDRERLLCLLKRAQNARRSCRTIAAVGRTGVSCDLQA